MATHSSILAWEIPQTEAPGGLRPEGLQSRTRLGAHTPLPCVCSLRTLWESLSVSLSNCQCQPDPFSPNPEASSHSQAHSSVCWDIIPLLKGETYHWDMQLSPLTFTTQKKKFFFDHYFAYRAKIVIFLIQKKDDFLLKLNSHLCL